MALLPIIATSSALQILQFQFFQNEPIHIFILAHTVRFKTIYSFGSASG